MGEVGNTNDQGPFRTYLVRYPRNQSLLVLLSQELPYPFNLFRFAGIFW